MRALLPRDGRPPIYDAWIHAALWEHREDWFAEAAHTIAPLVREVDDLVASIFARHFGAARDAEVRADYLAAMHAFAVDALPRAPARLAALGPDDPRRATADRHTLDGDPMWFAWALTIEAAALVGDDRDHARHALMMAGVATGCAANFTWRGHRRTRREYRADAATAALLRARGEAWADDLAAGAREVRALYRIREWGDD